MFLQKFLYSFHDSNAHAESIKVTNREDLSKKTKHEDQISYGL